MDDYKPLSMAEIKAAAEKWYPTTALLNAQCQNCQKQLRDQAAWYRYIAVTNEAQVKCEECYKNETF